MTRTFHGSGLGYAAGRGGLHQGRVVAAADRGSGVVGPTHSGDTAAGGQLSRCYSRARNWGRWLGHSGAERKVVGPSAGASARIRGLTHAGGTSAERSQLSGSVGRHGGMVHRIGPTGSDGAAAEARAGCPFQTPA
jgi:hypothetical protein